MPTLVAHLVFLAVAARALGWATDETPVPPPVWPLLAAFGALSFIEPWIARRRTGLQGATIAARAALVFAMLWAAPLLDFLPLLLLPLSFQVVHVFGARTGFAWIALFNLAIAAMLLGGMDWQPGLVMVLLSWMMTTLVGSFAMLMARNARARQENERLSGELALANRRLLDEAAQRQALAAAEERRRLAGELHDSLTQTLFSMNLAVQAALVCAPGGQAGPHLLRLQSLASGAAAEVQALAQRAQAGLPGDFDLPQALSALAAERKAGDNLEIELEITGRRALTSAQGQGVFHIVQEALNNVARHAGSPGVQVRLKLGPPLRLEVCDQGKGFDRQAAGFRPGFGLAGMAERAAALGWQIEVDSRPGGGTRIRLQEPLA